MSAYHDMTFKKLLNERSFLVSFCQTYLPQAIKQRIDWDSLRPLKLSGEVVSSYAPSEGRSDKVKESTYHSDVVFLFTFDDNQPGLLLCSEHQSQPDKLMALRMSHYIIGVLLQYAKHQKTSRLPAVISLLYYHGNRRYPYSLDLFDLFSDKALAFKYLTHPLLIDLSQCSDQELLSHGYISPAEIAFKHVFDHPISQETTSHLLEAIKDQGLGDKERAEVIKIVLRYCLNAWDYGDSDVFIDQTIGSIPYLRGDVMTMAEQLINQGVEKGMQQGIQQGENRGKIAIARNLLAIGLSADKISQATGLSWDEIKRLSNESC